jgi:hypothetical protein
LLKKICWEFGQVNSLSPTYIEKKISDKLTFFYIRIVFLA